MTPEPTPSPSELGQAIQQATDLTTKIVHEEIELAKAEMSAKASKLAKGAAVGAAGGIFAIFGVIYLFEGLAWLIWQQSDTETSFYVGFAIVALLLFIVAGLAAFVAYKLVKRGAPPTPQMAIDEGKKVRDTFKNA